MSRFSFHHERFHYRKGFSDKYHLIVPHLPGAGKATMPMLAICGCKEVNDMKRSLELLSENPYCGTMILQKANHDFPMRNSEDLNKILDPFFSKYA